MGLFGRSKKKVAKKKVKKKEKPSPKEGVNEAEK